MSTLPAAKPGPAALDGIIAYGETTNGGASEPPQFNLQVTRSLRRYPKLAATAGGAVFLLLVVLGSMQGVVYKAESRVFVDPLVPGGISPSNGQPGYDQFRYGSYLDQQIQTVTRADVLSAALRAVPAGTWRGAKETEQSAVGRLQKALAVERLTDGYEFSVKLSSPDARSSAALVNAVTNAYLQTARKDDMTEASGREHILFEERDRIRDALEADQREQAALGSALGVANPASEGANPFDLQLNNLRAQLAVAREAHDVAAAQLSSLTGSDSGLDATTGPGLTAAANESINSDLGLSSMKSAANARRSLIQTQMADLTPGNPLYKQDQDELAGLDRMMNSETARVRSAAETRIQNKLRADLERTAGVEADLSAQLASETATATGAGPKLLRANELATDVRRLNERYTEVDATLQTLKLLTNGPGLAHVTLKAAVPVAPEPNRRGLFLLAAVPLGLLCGLAAAVLTRSRDGGVYLGSDVEEILGFPPLAVLPARVDVPGFVAEEYVLRLAAGIEGAYRKGSARTFLVTPVSRQSRAQGLVASLAAKLEQMRLNVLVFRAGELVTDSSKTSQYVAAGGENERKARAALLRTSDGIATSKLERLKKDFDIVLIQAEPLLHCADTEYVARCADATILVAESGVTQRTELKTAASLLSRLRVTGVAVILDELRLRDADRTYKRTIEAALQHEEREPVVLTTFVPDQYVPSVAEAVSMMEEPISPKAVVLERAEPGVEVLHTLQGAESTETDDPESAEVVVSLATEGNVQVLDEIPASSSVVLQSEFKPVLSHSIPTEIKNSQLGRPIGVFRRESDRMEPESADPRANLIRPFVRGAKRADGTQIPSRFAPVETLHIPRSYEPYPKPVGTPVAEQIPETILSNAGAEDENALENGTSVATPPLRAADGLRSPREHNFQARWNVLRPARPEELPTLNGNARRPGDWLLSTVDATARHAGRFEARAMLRRMAAEVESPGLPRIASRQDDTPIPSTTTEEQSAVVPDTSALTRRWALLGQYESSENDPASSREEQPATVLAGEGDGNSDDKQRSLDVVWCPES